MSPNSEWIVGTQIGMRFVGDGDFVDNLLVSGLVRYEIPLNENHKWRIPVFTNLAELAAKSVDGTHEDTLKAATAALLNSSQGINIGLYPYRVSGGSNWLGDLRFTTFLQIVGKINTLKGRSSLTALPTDPLVDHTLMAGRGALGFELAIGTPDPNNAARRPLTTSVTFAGTGFNPRTYELIFNERKSWVPSIELSMVIPIRDGAGVLFEGIGARGHPGTWRVGMVIAAATKTARSAGPGDEAENRDSDPKATCLNAKRAELKKVTSDITDEQVKANETYKKCVEELKKP